MTVGPDSVIVQEDEPVAAEVDGEVVMLSERAGAYFGLDGIGSEIWRLIEEPRRVSELCGTLAQRYDVDAETLDPRRYGLPGRAARSQPRAARRRARRVKIQ